MMEQERLWFDKLYNNQQEDWKTFSKKRYKGFFDSLIYKYNDNLYYILLALYALWMCCGIFPLVCYEGDSSHIIVGCTILYNEGVKISPTYSYAYDMQPLVSYVIVGLKHIVPYLTCENIYCLISAILKLCSIGCLYFLYDCQYRFVAIWSCTSSEETRICSHTFRYDSDISDSLYVPKFRMCDKTLFVPNTFRLPFHIGSVGTYHRKDKAHIQIRIFRSAFPLFYH